MASERISHNPETVLPYGDGESKDVQVRRMFDTIAPVYDRMNRLMTFGLDRGWRRVALKMLRAYNPRKRDVRLSGYNGYRFVGRNARHCSEKMFRAELAGKNSL